MCTTRRSRALIGSNVMIFPSAITRLRELPRHLRELVLVPRAVPLGVDRDVLSLLAGAVGDARRQVLDRLEHLPALSDDASGVGPFDLEADLVLAPLAVVRREADLGVHRHLAEEQLG